MAFLKAKHHAERFIWAIHPNYQLVADPVDDYIPGLRYLLGHAFACSRVDWVS